MTVKTFNTVFALWLMGLACTGLSARAGEAAYPVETMTADWIDAARQGRVVPVKVYLPKGAERPVPVVIFSHGLGGTREGYGYLGEHWAAHGLVSVHVQHIGSDDAVWRGVPIWRRKASMRRAVADINNSTNRPADVSFTIDMLEKLNDDPDSPLHGRLDLTRIGVAGHSYGAFTSMAIAGQVFVGRDRKARAMADERVKAAVVMSAQAPRDPGDYDASYADIDIPILYMTGTKDTSPIGQSKSPADRRVAFDHTPGSTQGGQDTYLVTFAGGDHMIFSGRRRGRLDLSGKNDETFRRHIPEASLSFWDAYLVGDQQARVWLREGGFVEALGEVGVFEVKP
jgi:dienelactone hydrolase